MSISRMALAVPSRGCAKNVGRLEKNLPLLRAMVQRMMMMVETRLMLARLAMGALARVMAQGTTMMVETCLMLARLAMGALGVTMRVPRTMLWLRGARGKD